MINNSLLFTHAKLLHGLVSGYAIIRGLCCLSVCLSVRPFGVAYVDTLFI